MSKSKSKSNSRKDSLLGEPHGTANSRLKKAIIFMLAGEIDGRLACFRCGKTIADVRDLSIEHKESWQSAADPRMAFFDLKNIAFSHLRCNCATSGSGSLRGVAEQAKLKVVCPSGHQYDEKNTYVLGGKRRCRICDRDRKRRIRSAPVTQQAEVSVSKAE